MSPIPDDGMVYYGDTGASVKVDPDSGYIPLPTPSRILADLG
jgi:hypothetical protein